MIVIVKTRSRARRALKAKNAPSPEQIDEMTAEIRKTWSTRERLRRANRLGHVDLVEMPLQPRRKGFWGD